MTSIARPAMLVILLATGSCPLAAVHAAGETGAILDSPAAPWELPALASLAPHQRDELLDRRVILLPKTAAEGSDSAEFLQAYVIFEAPLERVVRLLTQSARQIEYRPELERIETVGRFPGGHLDEHHMRMLFLSVRYRLRHRIDVARHRIEWELDPDYDNDLAQVTGFWQLHALDAGHSLGHFGTAVDVGPAMPRFLQELGSRRHLPETMERVRRWVDSDGRWRP